MVWHRKSTFETLDGWAAKELARPQALLPGPQQQLQLSLTVAVLGAPSHLHLDPPQQHTPQNMTSWWGGACALWAAKLRGAVGRRGSGPTFKMCRLGASTWPQGQCQRQSLAEPGSTLQRPTLYKGGTPTKMCPFSNNAFCSHSRGKA